MVLKIVPCLTAHISKWLVGLVGPSGKNRDIWAPLTSTWAEMSKVNNHYTNVISCASSCRKLHKLFACCHGTSQRHALQPGAFCILFEIVVIASHSVKVAIP